jgi:5-(carboxyamino)imidazole ribonucleotide mutase
VSDAIRVAVVYGSASDTEVMSAAGKALEGYGVGYEEHVISAHRAPRTLVGWLEGLEARGVQAIIAGAGMSAALPGVVAAHTTLPVIGVPIKGGALDGLDALLAITQMPPGVPVASVGLNGARNAAILAVQILALSDSSLKSALQKTKADLEATAAEALANSAKGSK